VGISGRSFVRSPEVMASARLACLQRLQRGGQAGDRRRHLAADHVSQCQ
jgi:hypothetical protein